MSFLSRQSYRRKRHTPAAARDRHTAPLLAAAGITAAIFCGLPYVERLGPRPAPATALIPADSVLLPPAPPPPPPPATEPEPAPPPPKPELSEPRQPIPLNVVLDLDMALGEWRPGDFAAGLSFSIEGLAGPRDVYELTELDAPPRPVTQLRPLYPARARARRIEGSVTLVFVVDANGVVRDIEPVAAHPDDTFVEAAMRAAARWRFSPGIRHGKPVPVRVRQTIRFQLDD